MLTEDQLTEIRSILKNAENPLYFYDDDPDGFCSFLLLKKHFEKGKGIIIKRAILDTIYINKINENKPDLVVILDKPLISQEFIDNTNTKLIWIDHHKPQSSLKGIKSYNPLLQKPYDSKPITYWCYRLTNENLWIAMCGIIGDWYLPEFTNEFIKQYPDLLPKNIKDPGKALYATKLGELARVFSFILKGSISDIKKYTTIILKIESPYEILNQETPRGKFIYKQYQKVNKKYQILLQKAIAQKSKDNFLIFTYLSEKMSFTGDLSNELIFRFPNKIIIIGREKDDELRLSLRSSNIHLPELIKKSLQGVNGYGGGHPHACGANVKTNDFPRFIENLKKNLK